MSNNNRRTYSGERRRRSSSSNTQERRRARRERSGSRPNLSERDSLEYRRRQRRLREKRIRAQRRRRRLFLLVLVFVVFLTGRSFMSLMNKEPNKEEVAITTVDSGGGIPEGSNTAQSAGTVEKPVFGTYEKKNWIHNLNLAAKTNPNAKRIVDNIDNLSDPLIKLSGNNFDAIDFVAKSIDPAVENKFRYPESINSEKFPYYIQWDDRWGYEKYAGGIIGYTGCAPTVMAMAVSGITGTKTTPAEMAKIAEENGFSNDSGTGWDYYPFMAKEYGLQLEELPKDDRQMKKHLQEGHPIIISVKPGQFTQVGHIMMLVGVDEDGKYIINDPNNLQNTQKHWEYSEFQGDLKKIWALYK
ncbi:MAG: C39 family peptidase [Gallicola sp.]|uniref:C39 family peptidase n=1 Tax=Gallicola sp. Sow4_E12 TaxID=3438785 RepID=UPI0017AA5BD4|nr:C39 family peptidase [Gallicola sp.]